ncbi:hypothetical protein [Azospira sp. I09]|uniref:hypothetical protein n=1 Tax=Azospira sp. I09 TaxID=1765049 RepID=UPI001260AB5A|nr:hypothetical protein [Azospira sp. I09]BBN90127.1 hypothetical protein AZSP09_31500 [Azospira sp. I09]
MNKPAEPTFATRSTVTIELPLAKNTRILHPEQVILRIDSSCYDVGAFCYVLRSHKRRKPGQPREVVFISFLKQRPRQILQLIKALSCFITDGGKRMATVQSYMMSLKLFLDWADANGLHDCLSGGDATRHAYLAWAEDTRERYCRQEFGEHVHNHRLDSILNLLEAVTGLEDLHRGTRKVIRCRNPNNGTDPLAPHDFTHAVALNQALFDGLCDLVLEQRPFPYKLMLPATLGWAENHLWLFPTQMWRLPPHQWGAEREKLKQPYWAYDYTAGRLATTGEIAHRYAMWRFPSDRQKIAKDFIAKAQARINAANADDRGRVRIMLGVHAHNAFLYLFFCNTGINESVAREIETDGEIDMATLNQQYRSLKFRAGGKLIALTVPATFMPSLRRFMDLRRYLLGVKSFPYLFFTLGPNHVMFPKRIRSGALQALYQNLLCAIDPQLPRIGSRKLRASVADWYQRHHDASVTAKVLQNSEQTTRKRYDAGSVTDHREELSLFLHSVSASAKRQRVISKAVVADARPLEEGGSCDGFGHPEALADRVPVKPNCKDSQGCLFCTHRVLVACEEDARKVASAAFVMEQVILGPKHEDALRPLIAKCDKDLEKIAAFGNCRTMVEWVRKDVFENGNLWPFFADKYQLFLELGVIV